MIEQRPELVVLVGPPGSGKTTHAEELVKQKFIRVNQDDQGKEGHKVLFFSSLQQRSNIVIDRMNFTKEQRQFYIQKAVENGYITKIKVLHENYDTCLERCKKRQNHPTIKDMKTASKALNSFFSKYEKPSLDEADIVEFIYSSIPTTKVVICDLDGTLCNIDHRLHYIKTEGKKDWKKFFNALNDDTPNEWCRYLLFCISAIGSYDIVFASGRSDSHYDQTRQWLERHLPGSRTVPLFMRPRSDFRKDVIIKEIILDFEIKTRWEPFFFIDDRQSVVDMWRSKGYTVLQCDKGDF